MFTFILKRLKKQAGRQAPTYYTEDEEEGKEKKSYSRFDFDNFVTDSLLLSAKSNAAIPSEAQLVRFSQILVILDMSPDIIVLKLMSKI